MNAANAASQRFAIAYTGFNRALLGLLGLGASRSSVTVSADAVTVHMGWAFDGTIPRSHITSAARDRKPAMFGWGVHGWAGRWVVNGSDEGIVKLTIDPPVHVRSIFLAIRPHELFISLEDPDRFVAELNQA